MICLEQKIRFSVVTFLASLRSNPANEINSASRAALAFDKGLCN